MPSLPKVGPFTRAELLAYMKTLVDSVYLQPLLEQGEGAGLEAFTQINAQLARVSEAVDRTLQSMFILPWSGQSDLPASGAARAEVALDFTRSATIDFPLTLVAGLTVEETTTDYGDGGGVAVTTGRRYALVGDVTLLPGSTAVQSCLARSERDGYGFNNPLPGTLTTILQTGANLANDRATVAPGTYVHKVTAWTTPDVFVPEHVGCYLQFTAGSNAGQTRRIVGYEAATSSDGGSVLLAKTAIIKAAGLGAYVPGEALLINGATHAVVVAGNADYLVIERVDGPIAVGNAVTSSTSGLAFVIAAIDLMPELVAEVGTASWRVLAWGDFGLSTTNPASPTGGKLAVLDELGAERGINRAPNEPDASYVKRISQLPDTISPNAIRRICNRILAQYSVGICLREVGLELFRGLFYDGDPTSTDPAVSFAYDMDHVTLSGAPVGTFFEGELVEQVGADGVIAQGRACVTPPPSPGITGVANVSGTFVVGLPIVGKVSGATMDVLGVSGGLRPEDRFKLTLDYTEFRAFFLIGFPPLHLGDFGMAYDVGGSNAYDLTGNASDFYDGWPITTAQVYQSIWNAVDKAKAAGVSMDAYIERIGCM